MAYSIHKDIGGGWYIAENGRPVAFYGSNAQAEKALAVFVRLNREAA